jgi:hypothetical protein
VRRFLASGKNSQRLGTVHLLFVSEEFNPRLLYRMSQFDTLGVKYQTDRAAAAIICVFFMVSFRRVGKPADVTGYTCGQDCIGGMHARN